MSGRGMDFLKAWMKRNISDADRNGTQMRAIALADSCIAAAAAAGISLDDLEPGWGSVETVIYEAMQNDLRIALANKSSHGLNGSAKRAINLHPKKTTVIPA